LHFLPRIDRWLLGKNYSPVRQHKQVLGDINTPGQLHLDETVTERGNSPSHPTTPAIAKRAGEAYVERTTHNEGSTD
jgi:hypothetical protein